MNKEVKVTLGVRIQEFISGLNTARSAFSGFVHGMQGGIQDGLANWAHLKEVIQGVGQLFNWLKGVAEGLFNTFVSGVAVEERLRKQFVGLVGDAATAKDFLASMAQENARLGFVTDDMLPSINQFAVALKGLDGAVKPEKLGQMADMFRRIKAARPDLSADEITRAIVQAARGDVERIKMLLGVGLDQVTGLSEKAQKTMQALKATGDQQLGEVTKVGSSIQPQTQDLLDLFDEYLDKLGMTKQATEDTANDWERNVARMQEIWDNLKDTIGGPILETLNKELGKLADWLMAHQTEIDAFAEKIGSLAATGLENAMEALMKVDWDQVMASGVAFAEAFSKVDWASIAQAVGVIGKFMGLGGEGQKQKDIQANQAGPMGQLFGGLNKAAEGLGLDNPRVAGASSQQIEVKISMDDDMNLKAKVSQVAGKAANQAVGNLVKSTVSKSGGSQHN